MQSQSCNMLRKPTGTRVHRRSKHQILPFGSYYPRMTTWSTQIPTSTNKIFASTWISPSHVLFASKCGTLSLYDTESGVCSEYAIQQDHRPVWTRDDILERPTATCKSIHDLSHDPLSNRVVCAGAKLGKDVAVLRPSNNFEVSDLFEGHRDWVFGVEWINSSIIASCSRDCTLRLWNADPHSNLDHTIQGKDRVIAIGHDTNQIRSLVTGHNGGNIATISKDKIFKIWDTTVGLAVHTEKYLEERSNTVVVAATNNYDGVYAVGSFQGITLLDQRCQNSCFINTKNFIHGIRSITFENSGSYIRCGGNDAKLSLIDNRMGKVLCTISMIEDAPIQDTSLTVYTHSWNPLRNQLFVAGGPFYSNFAGSFSGILNVKDESPCL